MIGEGKYTGFAIALAWPQTYCKQPGAWYDPITLWLGINRNNYYKVGHAALVLIDKTKAKAHYFDFGRYHAPYKHGRVRSAQSDHDLAITTIPRFSNNGDHLENYKDILLELQTNPACHGEGELHAAYCPIDFELAFEQANKMQALGSIPYGPFQHKGSNCSRFVNTCILAGKPQFKHTFSLNYFVPLTPTPLSNVKALNKPIILPKLLKGEPFCPTQKLDKQALRSTLPKPPKHSSIPDGARWLSGEGAGSWFHITFEDALLKLTRYSPNGQVECSGLFENKDSFNALKSQNAYTLAYPSHCKMVTLIVKNKAFQFHRVS